MSLRRSLGVLVALAILACAVGPIPKASAQSTASAKAPASVSSSTSAVTQFKSIDQAFEKIGSMTIRVRNGETIEVALRDQIPVITVDGHELSNLQVNTNNGAIEIHSLGLFHPDLLITSIALDRTGSLVVNTSDGDGNNAIRVIVDQAGINNTVRARAATCRCFGGDATTVKRVCPNNDCDNAGTSCNTAGSVAYCQYRQSQTDVVVIVGDNVDHPDR